ncbi:MAG: SDR family oxidoreductase [Candidatus Thorarchaeota archaeon]
MITVFVTGANRGLGLEFTRQYLKGNDRVIASCRNPDTATELKDLQQEFQETLFIVKLDVTSEDERNNAFEIIKKKFEVIDVLINNAGVISGDGENISVLGEVYKEDFSRVLLVNTISPLLITERFLPLLRQSENGKIIMMSSQNGSISLRTVGGKYSYATSKAALNMVTRILGNDLREDGIATVAIHPGWIRTDMGGPEAPLEKDTPIRQIIELVDRIDLSYSGMFLDREGKAVPW